MEKSVEYDFLYGMPPKELSLALKQLGIYERVKLLVSEVDGKKIATLSISCGQRDDEDFKNNLGKGFYISGKVLHKSGPILGDNLYKESIDLLWTSFMAELLADSLANHFDLKIDRKGKIETKAENQEEVADKENTPKKHSVDKQDVSEFFKKMNSYFGQ